MMYVKSICIYLCGLKYVTFSTQARNFLINIYIYNFTNQLLQGSAKFNTVYDTKYLFIHIVKSAAVSCALNDILYLIYLYCDWCKVFEIFNESGDMYTYHDQCRPAHSIQHLSIDSDLLNDRMVRSWILNDLDEVVCFAYLYQSH